MKLLTTHLKEGENRFEFENPKDSWVSTLVQKVTDEGNILHSPLHLQLSLTKLDPDYYLRGKIQFKISQLCARCAESFTQPIEHSFGVALAHVSNHRVAEAPVSEEESENLDINFFEGNEIELSSIVEEQFYLSLPFQSICAESCKGMCQFCGKNLNLSDCGCSKTLNPSSFSVLENFRP